MILLIHFIVLLISVVSANEDVLCRDEQGNPVDWYYLYKLPRLHRKNTEEETIQLSGYIYMYISSLTVNNAWQLSKLSINDSGSFPGQTLSNVMQRQDIIRVAYNDEPPKGQTSYESGHTKGVIASDNNTGFWLIHSVPKYPKIGEYEYPETGVHYGQSFLCLSLNASEIDLVGRQQVFNEPIIYDAQMPDRFRDKYPNLVRAIERKWQSKAPFWNYQSLITIDGARFGSFAKGSKFQAEIYEDWIAPTLSTDLLVQSWRHGPGALPTDCTKNHWVMNIETITESGTLFNSTQDHSKWCVSGSHSYDWICIGDINRSEHQKKRGGGAVCHFNNKIADAYRNLIKYIEKCPKKSWLEKKITDIFKSNQHKYEQIKKKLKPNHNKPLLIPKHKKRHLKTKDDKPLLKPKHNKPLLKTKHNKSKQICVIKH